MMVASKARSSLGRRGVGAEGLLGEAKAAFRHSIGDKLQLIGLLTGTCVPREVLRRVYEHIYHEVCFMT